MFQRFIKEGKFIVSSTVNSKCIVGLPFVCSRRLSLTREGDRCLMNSNIGKWFGKIGIHLINTGESQPIMSNTYRLGAAKDFEISKIFRQYLDEGIIRPSTCP